MASFFLLWLIHSLGWFLASSLRAVASGDGGPLHIKSATALGLSSTAFQYLLQLYLN